MNEFNTKLLKQFIKSEIEYTSFTLCNDLKIENIDAVENSLKDLLSLGYIKIVHEDLDYVSYRLTPIGRDYFKNKSKNIFDKYIFKIILSLISFVLGLISGLLLR